MKKYIVLALVALLLVCAVSCSATKGMGKLEIEVSVASGTDITWTDIETATLEIETAVELKGEDFDCSVVLKVEDVQNGKVTVYLPEGSYRAEICLGGENVPYYNYSGKVMPKTKTINSIFEITAGETTYCECVIGTRD